MPSINDTNPSATIGRGFMIADHNLDPGLFEARVTDIRPDGYEGLRSRGGMLPRFAGQSR